MLGQDADHTARPARSAGPSGHHARILDDAAGLNLGRATGAASVGQLVQDRAARPAARPPSPWQRRRRVSRFSGRDRSEKPARPGHRDCPPGQDAAADRCEVDPVDRDYFAREIAPLLQDPLVEFIGEIGEAEKSPFLGDAAALLFPIDWPEPFGLVLIEAMATGTPVIAFGSGSVPEIIEEGVTGFIVDDVDCAVAAVPLALRLDRAPVRRRFEQRFTAERMALDYVSI